MAVLNRPPNRRSRWRLPVIVSASLVTATALVLPAGPASAAGTRYEAESSPAVCDGTIESNWSGFSGSGFCNTGNYSGAAVQFTVSASAAKTATLRIKFANGTTAGRSADVLVNGARVQSTSFEPTGAWSTWAWKTWTVSLRSGGNTIRFASTNSNGMPNVDYLDVSDDSSPPPPPSGGLVGWATVNGTTTGGQGGSTVTVTSGSQLISAMQASGPRVIRVQGTISLSGMNDVASNKTIEGVGSSATITGGGLDIDGVGNVIIRNLNFRDWSDDAINVQDGSHHVWIDHNSLSNGYDGAIDIKRESDYITVSWNRIFNHGKSMLLGHSDGHTADRGHLRVTYHHNWFDGSGTRHPRVRYGNPVHVFNNYYDNNEYGVASTQEAGVLVEGNYFENTPDPCLRGYGSSDPGSIVQRSNHFVSSGSCASGGSVGNVPYSYSLDTASNVKSIVMSGAGAGRISV